LVSSLGRANQVIGLTTIGILLVGCYTLQPTGRVVPEAGTKIALSVNDAGRAALGGQMGPEIDLVEGLLVQKDSSDYVLAVSFVRLLRGGEQKWNGEKIHIKPEFVTAVYERRFSRERSVAMGAIGLGALYFLVTRSIVGSGLGEPMKPPGDTANTLRRPR
jgi:hypothetical protein